jgi:hypothetical protein
MSARTEANRGGIDPEQQQAIFDQLSELLKMDDGRRTTEDGWKRSAAR